MFIDLEAFLIKRKYTKIDRLEIKNTFFCSKVSRKSLKENATIKKTLGLSFYKYLKISMEKSFLY